MVDKPYVKIHNDISRKLAGLSVVGGGSMSPNVNNDISSISDDKFRTYAERLILEFARMTQWRDNPKAGPPFASDKDRVRRLKAFPEPFLKECVRYQTTKDSIDGWLKLTPEQRYQRKKSEWSTHECSVHTRYGNWYAAPDMMGCAASTETERGVCVPECEYYPDVGTIEDSELLTWYADVLEGRDYNTLKKDNDQFMKEFIDLLKSNARDTPAAAKFAFDTDYWPRLEDLEP